MISAILSVFRSYVGFWRHLKQLKHRKKVEETTIELFRCWIIKKDGIPKRHIQIQCMNSIYDNGFVLML